jgi:hypothetical protein
VAYINYKYIESVVCVHVVDVHDVFYIRNFLKFYIYIFNFGLGIAFLLSFYFLPGFRLYNGSLLSLVCEPTDLCILTVNLLLLASNDDPLRVETYSVFL